MAETTRWTVRACPEHGLFPATALTCPWRYGTSCSEMSEPFEVVRAVGARSSDPDTSKLAALRQQPRSGSQRARILEALQRRSPTALSARQIENLTGIKGAWKRISELRQGGHIYEASVVRDPITGADVTLYASLSARVLPGQQGNGRIGTGQVECG